MEQLLTHMEQIQTNSSDLILAAFYAYLKHSSDMIFVKDINLIYQSASLPFIHMVGKTCPEDIIGKTDFEIFENPELAKRYTADDKKLLTDGKNLISYIEPLTDDNGLARYSSTSKYILKNASGETMGILGISRDVTREYIARRRHQQELQYLFELPEDTYAALFMDIEEWRIIRHHRHTVGNQIINVCETMDAFTQSAIENLADPSDQKTFDFYRSLSRDSLLALCDQGVRNHTLTYLRQMPNGEKIWVRTDINFLIDPENGHLCAIWTLRDIHSQMQETIHLHEAAEHDSLTGLLNRASTTKQIEETLKQTDSAQHALFIIDIDNFKLLNDTYGHQAGDHFLSALAQMLKQCFRDNDVIGRIGGDEFFILMKHIPSSLIASEKAAALIRSSHAICDAFSDIPLSLSIGISMSPVHGTDLDTLYEHADKALYQAKRKGKNSFVFAE